MTLANRIIIEQGIRLFSLDRWLILIRTWPNLVRRAGARQFQLESRTLDPCIHPPMLPFLLHETGLLGTEPASQGSKGSMYHVCCTFCSATFGNCVLENHLANNEQRMTNE